MPDPAVRPAAPDTALDAEDAKLVTLARGARGRAGAAEGAIAAASVLTGIDPTIAAILGLIIGAPTSFGFHTLKAGTRVASSAATFGCANPVISLAEDVISFGLSIVAIFAPLIVPVALVILFWLLWTLVKKIRRGAIATSAAPG